MTNTALIIIPEEAERLIPLIHLAKQPLTHLLMYAASVTRKMLQFNGLDYYAIPNLPSGWEAPMWLMIELGILAGRLYFEFKEYNSLCQYLGSQQASKMLEGNSEAVFRNPPPNAKALTEVAEGGEQIHRKSSLNLQHEFQ
ncbi:MAG: hypothetical protein FRX48_06252 [Lasallia pustulata]|uniref:Uncharacterized protein n=1 Tax=Lasallia pustulata TaxID=136370 RepID=A0A5M8PKQ9_9LECA|nr:MAG: hypothetical protein FRX48_06252 [Lasallia pustulata]